MTVTEKVHDIVFVVEYEGKEPKKCYYCNCIYFKERPKTKSPFDARYVDCIKCGSPHRIGGFVWGS
jgi:hypothetical protein